MIEGADKKNVTRDAAFITVAAIAMIVSDCYSLFGPWVVYVKYIALLMLVLCVFARMFTIKVARARIVMIVFGVAILFSEMLLQQSEYPREQAAGLFLLVAAMAIGSPLILRSYRPLFVCGLVSTGLIGLLLLVVLPDCISQFNLYVSIGRPRLKGCFSNPNSLGHISAIVLIIVAIARMKAVSDKREKRLADLCLVLCVLFLLLSGSRTAQASAAVFALVLLFRWIENRFSSRSAVVLGRLLVLVTILTLVYSSYEAVLSDYMLSGRAISWSNLGSIESFFGYGYVSSAGASYITTAANGNVEMLWVSLYYRVGIIGMFGYVLLLAGAIRTGYKKGFLFYALFAAIFVQTLGESYLSSVMSFPALFDWLLIGGIAVLDMRSDADALSVQVATVNGGRMMR